MVRRTDMLATPLHTATVRHVAQASSISRSEAMVLVCAWHKYLHSLPIPCHVAQRLWLSEKVELLRTAHGRTSQARMNQLLQAAVREKVLRDDRQSSDMAVVRHVTSMQATLRRASQHIFAEIDRAVAEPSLCPLAPWYNSQPLDFSRTSVQDVVRLNHHCTCSHCAAFRQVVLTLGPAFQACQPLAAARPSSGPSVDSGFVLGPQRRRRTNHAEAFRLAGTQ